MQKRIALSILLLAATLSVAAMSTLDSLFVMLDQDVAQTAHYNALHQQRIDSLKAIHPMTKALQLRIAREYQYYQSDSACAWYLRLLDCEEPYRTQAYMGLVQLSYSIGKYGDGMVLLSEVQSVPTACASTGWKPSGACIPRPPLRHAYRRCGINCYAQRSSTTTHYCTRWRVRRRVIRISAYDTRF